MRFHALVVTWLVAARSGAEVIDLDDAAAANASIVGSKAANLARARRAGLPALPGFAIPVGSGASAAVDSSYLALSDGGTRPVVVRSSSPSEDTANSSQAGRFTSVVDVRGIDEFVAAVAVVFASGDGQPMAVLVQPHLDPARLTRETRSSP